MAFVMKSIAVLAQWGAAAAFSPGDCAFVGIYGDKDDFAVLLLEDVNGESLSLTDANFKDRDLKVDQWQWAEAKAHVKDAQKGTILRKWDFDTNSQNAFAAPVSLTVIKGSPGMTESPSVLCGINMAQPQNRQLSTSNGLELVEAETAEYVGPKFGTKEDLFQSMTDPSNWGRQSRQLSSFTVASGNTTTMPTSTTEDDDDDDDDDDESTTEEQVTSTEEQVTSTEDHDDHDDHDDNGTGPTDGGAPRLCAVGGGFAALALLTQ